MLYGEHLHAHEDEEHTPCGGCRARATEEVFDRTGLSHGCFCQRCGRRKLKALQRIENLFARKGVP